MKLKNLGSRCFLCGNTEACFDTAMRICDCVRPHGFPENELSCYVSVLPEHNYSIFDLPSLWAAAPSDIFAVAADSLVGDAQKAASRAEFIATRSCSAPPLLSTDVLATQHHLRCGNSIVYRSAELEDLTGSALVLVLDMGSYYWSGTLKDPRSWAIINTALTYGITDISVWTNDISFDSGPGDSGSKLASNCNRVRANKFSVARWHRRLVSRVLPRIERP